jgi:hypothetical protein
VIRVTTLEFHDDRVLRLFPEAVTLAVLEAALVATEHVLRVEHPAVDQIPLDPEHDLDPGLLTAHLILARAAEIHHLLRLYAASLRRDVAFDSDERCPF